MYTSTEEARSDLFLAGAVYVFGPLVINLLLRIVPLGRVPVLGIAIILALPLATTVLVPVLLIRYRREPLSMYGLGADGSGAVLGLTVAAPLVLAAIAAGLLRTGGPYEPPVVVTDLRDALGLVERLFAWLGLAGLAVYGTVKARDAFHSDARSPREVVPRIGRVLLIVAAVATLLLLLAAWPFDVRTIAALVLVPVGAAGAVFVVWSGLRGPLVTTRATLVTPTVLVALRPLLQVGLLGALFVPAQFTNAVWVASWYAAVGLAIGLLQESRRSAVPALMLATALALLTPL
jgi:hypothetical protein